MPTTLGKYQIGHTLGSGVSCKVKLAKDAAGTRYAIKILHNNAEFIDLIKAEVQTLKALQHPNIVNLIEEAQGVMSNPKKNQTKTVDYLVLELVAGGDLFDFVANSGRFSDDVARYYMNQLMDALDYMHSNNCAHRDLKPENIMLDSEFNLKVADFGFAAPVSGRDGSGYLTTQLGTKMYMAPEIHLAKPYTGPGVDLFASAIILFIMLSQQPPFNSPNPQDPYYRLLAADRADLFWKAHDDSQGGTSIFSDEFKDLFTLMTKLNPAHRPDMDQIRNHAWMQGKNLSKSQIQQEFRTRKQSVDAEAANERDEKRAERADRRYEETTNRGDGPSSPFIQQMSEEEKSTFDDDMTEWKKIELEDYEETMSTMTAFFTTAQPNEVAYDLCEYLWTQWKIKAELDAESQKIKFQFNEELADEEDQLKVTGPGNKVTVKISRVDDEKICVDFKRRSGDQFIFQSKFKEIMESDKMRVFKDVSLL